MSERNEAPPAPTKGVPIMLDRQRYLRFTLKTLRKIREELGEDALTAGVSGEKLAKVLCYGLQGDDPSLTPDQVEDIIDLSQMDDLVVALRKAMGQKATITVDPRTPAPAASADAQSA